MASEHILKLKATLDTSEVLSKLRQINQNAKSTGQGTSGQPAMQSNNISNVLLRLNQSISNLSRAISRLSVSSQKQASASAAVAYSTRTAGAPIAIGPGAAQHNAAPQFLSWQEYNKGRALKLLGTRGFNLDRQSFVNLMTRTDYSSRQFQGFFPGLTSNDYSTFLSFVAAHKNYKPPKPMPMKIDPMFKRMIGFGIGSYGLGGISNAFGNVIGQNDLVDFYGAQVKSSTLTSAISNIGQGAMMGSMFGPYGAGAGALAGAILSAAEAWISSLGDSEKELAKWNARVKEAQSFIKARSLYAQNREISLAAEGEDTAKLKTLQGTLKARESLLLKWLANEDKNALAGEVSLNAMQWLQELEQIQGKLKSISNAIESIDNKKKQEQNRIKQVDKIGDSLRASYNRERESIRNSRLIEDLRMNDVNDPYHQNSWYDWKHDIGLTGKNALDYSSKAKSLRSKYLDLLSRAKSETDIEKKTLLMDQAREMQDTYKFNESQASTFEGALKAILQSLVNALQSIPGFAGNVDNLNSLDAQGYYMSNNQDLLWNAVESTIELKVGKSNELLTQIRNVIVEIRNNELDTNGQAQFQ